MPKQEQTRPRKRVSKNKRRKKDKSRVKLANDELNIILRVMSGRKRLAYTDVPKRSVTKISTNTDAPFPREKRPVFRPKKSASIIITKALITKINTSDIKKSPFLLRGAVNL